MLAVRSRAGPVPQPVAYQAATRRSYGPGDLLISPGKRILSAASGPRRGAVPRGRAAARRREAIVTLGTFVAPARRGQLLRRVSILLSLALVAALTQAQPAPAGATTAAAVPQCPAARADETPALLAGRVCGQRVQVSGATSESTLLWANPDGTLMPEVHGGPVRVKQPGAAAGDPATWVPVDLTLSAQADGSVVAGAHPRGLRLSGAAGAGE